MRQGLLAAAMLFSLGAGAQDTLTTYLDGGWNKSDKDHAKYYQKAVQHDGLWFVDQYLVEGNQLELSGSYKIVDAIRHGHFVEYHKNGNKKAEGDYIDNIQVGSWVRWYSDGTVSSKEVYLSEAADIVKIIEQDSLIRTKYKSHHKRYGYDGIRQGLCTWYHSNGKVSAKEIYKDAKIIDARFWDEQGNAQTVDVKDVYDNTVQPQFKGKSLMNFLMKSLNYPSSSIIRGTTGKVLVVFAVDIDGSIVDYEVKKSLGDQAIDRECLRLVKLLNGMFVPGTAHNRIVKTHFTLPISFK